MKRLSLSMPNLLKQIPNLNFKYELLKKLSADYTRSYHGLADLHEYYAFDTTEIAAGHLKDLKTGKIFKSNSPLSSEELLQIADEAKEVLYLEGYVYWISAAIKMAKIEKKSSQYINEIK